jgi:hypothetical protein
MLCEVETRIYSKTKMLVTAFLRVNDQAAYKESYDLLDRLTNQQAFGVFAHPDQYCGQIKKGDKKAIHRIRCKC